MLTEKMLLCNLFLLLSSLPFQSTVAVASTCYAPINSTQHLQLLAHYSVVNQTACAGFCDQNNECTGYSYQPTPLENKCALLGAVIPSEVCLIPKQIFQQQKTNVNCKFCPLPKNVQADSCIDSVVGPLNSTGDMCTRLNVSGRNSTYYIIRATLPDGSLMTLDNDWSSKLVCSNDQWTYTYLGKQLSPPLAAASCVLAGPTKCPCAPLPTVEGMTSAVVDKINPCPSNTELNFWYTNLNTTRSIGKSDTVLTVIKCMAGEWICFQTGTGNTWRVKSAGCK